VLGRGEGGEEKWEAEADQGSCGCLTQPMSLELMKNGRSTMCPGTWPVSHTGPSRMYS
jgi:hypothetical protein